LPWVCEERVLRNDDIGFDRLNERLELLHDGGVVRQILLPHGSWGETASHELAFERRLGRQRNFQSTDKFNL
jgi:hypothetical protein